MPTDRVVPSRISRGRTLVSNRRRGTIVPLEQRSFAPIDCSCSSTERPISWLQMELRNELHSSHRGLREMLAEVLTRAEGNRGFTKRRTLTCSAEMGGMVLPTEALSGACPASKRRGRIPSPDYRFVAGRFMRRTRSWKRRSECRASRSCSTIKNTM